MAGTHEGGLKVSKTVTTRFSRDYYAIIGRKGGKKSKGGGFTNNPELASRAGHLGGSISRRPVMYKTFDAEAAEKEFSEINDLYRLSRAYVKYKYRKSTDEEALVTLDALRNKRRLEILEERDRLEAENNNK